MLHRRPHRARGGPSHEKRPGGRDPLTLGVLPLFLFGIGPLASYVPARRAARLDPE